MPVGAPSPRPGDERQQKRSRQKLEKETDGVAAVAREIIEKSRPIKESAIAEPGIFITGMIDRGDPSHESRGQANHAKKPPRQIAPSALNEQISRRSQPKERRGLRPLD